MQQIWDDTNQELAREKKKQEEKDRRQKGELGSRRVERSRERSPPQRPRMCSPSKSPGNLKDPTPEKNGKEKEKLEKKNPTPEKEKEKSEKKDLSPKKAPPKKRQTIERERAEAAAAEPSVPAKKVKSPPDSSSKVGTGMFDSQPSGARSRQAELDKQFQKAQEKQKIVQSKEAQVAKDAGEVEEQPVLTPTPAVLASASATVF